MDLRKLPASSGVDKVPSASVPGAAERFLQRALERELLLRRLATELEDLTQIREQAGQGSSGARRGEYLDTKIEARKRALEIFGEVSAAPPDRTRAIRAQFRDAVRDEASQLETPGERRALEEAGRWLEERLKAAARAGTK
ncbi:MAG: hypothetical protein IT384_10770 [Deltaproteobacteria bacterium]|nr:hypothetical protein [Deltaproteobacteria bacterium]